ncbi:MAG TPA: branched-chain amino acid ABC transporter permease [Anaerolineae bacterium]|jgi:branched-chain amino acid transport system permease protein|nr:branched-chain amino acid ABC transporter permease [Anaerolineae bacterium]
MDKPTSTSAQTRLRLERNIRAFAGIVIGIFLLWRIYNVVVVQQNFGIDTWVRFSLSGLILGGMYALIAIGYTLVYGIMFMINFAHGEVMMLGAFGGFFTFEILRFIPAPTDVNPDLNFLNAHPFISVFLAFLVGIFISGMSGYFLEKIAYRPLRKAPRLILLITAIGASIFLQNLAMLLFGPQRKNVVNPDILNRGTGWILNVGGNDVLISYTGIFSLVLSSILMVGLYILVQRTKLGRAMRAVAQDKNTAALMGVDVDDVISKTFIISGVLAGAAGVMWSIHMGLVNHYTGFLPGIKAFTAAVMGGIGNIPGAMLGGMVLGIIEAIGPAALGIDFQLKDVIAFSILVLVLIVRPSGILGEKLSEEKL